MKHKNRAQRRKERLARACARRLQDPETRKAQIEWETLRGIDLGKTIMTIDEFRQQYPDSQQAQLTPQEEEAIADLVADRIGKYTLSPEEFKERYIRPIAEDLARRDDAAITRKIGKLFT